MGLDEIIEFWRYDFKMKDGLDTFIKTVKTDGFDISVPLNLRVLIIGWVNASPGLDANFFADKIIKNILDLSSC